MQIPAVEIDNVQVDATLNRDKGIKELSTEIDIVPCSLRTNPSVFMGREATEGQKLGCIEDHELYVLTRFFSLRCLELVSNILCINW